VSSGNSIAAPNTRRLCCVWYR